MSKKINVCRPITFYNNFMPSEEMEVIWDYCAFGAIDGVDVGENILLNGNRTVTECIWESQKQFCSNLKGHYAAQQVYAIRFDEQDAECAFWSGNNDYPFFFFSRIQCDENRTEVWKNREKLEKALQIQDKVKAMIYLTYDNTDLLLVLRTVKYEIGAEVINALHQKVNMSLNSSRQCIVKNSCTTFAVRYDWIKEYVLRNRSELNRDKIDNVRIRLIECKNGIVNAVYNELNKRLCANGLNIQSACIPVLGADDDVIILYDIGWGDFLSLYCKDTGVFTTKKGNNYCQYVAGVTTQIEQKLQNRLKELEYCGIVVCDSQSSGDDLWKDSYRSRIKQIYDLLETDNSGADLKEVYIILNALSKFDGELFNDYAFFPILDSLRTLLQLMKIDAEDKEQFYDFLNRFSMYAQSSAISDKHATQMLSFNAKIYDVPIKLVAFYNAYLHSIKNILNTEKNSEYSFFVVPGRNDCVNVNERYQRVSSCKRLMIVEIPEYSAYRLNDMMIILAHETAHYVGDLFRDRETRYTELIRSYAYIYIRYVRSEICQKVEWEIEDFVWKEIEDRVESILSRRVKCESDKEYILHRKKLNVLPEVKEKIAQRYKEYSDFFMELNGCIRIAMLEIIPYGLREIFDPILYKMSHDESYYIERLLREISEKFMMTYPEGSTCFGSDTVLNKLESLYRECFADLMVILILGLNARQYIECMFLNAKEQDMEIDDLCRSDVIFRLIAVIITIVHEESEQSSEWVKNLTDKCNEDWFRVGQSALEQWDKFPFENIDEGNEYKVNELNAFRNKKVMRNLIHYLLSCQHQFLTYEDHDREKIVQVRKIFRECNGQLNLSIESQISEMEEFIQAYKQSLLQESELTKELK